jgi:60 kDa SS-A/Ro ribonucleoprotein
MTQHSALTGSRRQGTPQSQPIPGSGQVPNSAGGYAYGVDCWERLNRFLILGIEGGTYYIGQRDLAAENASVVRECLKADGPRLVKTIIEVSDAGRAPSNDPALFALAVAAKEGDDLTRKQAQNAIGKVARTGTHLFHFIDFVRSMGGLGRGLKRAIGEWYGRDVGDVAYQAVKYRQRDGWTHRDILRLAKPASSKLSGAHSALFDFITDKEVNTYELPPMVQGYLKAQKAEKPAETAALIREYRLPWEAIKTEHANDLAVQEALFEHMPMGALVRQLNRLTANGLLTPSGEHTREAVKRLTDAEQIRKSRLHPIAVLSAMKTYQQGHGVRGGLSWDPVTKIVDALDEAFYVSFGNVESTGKRILIALDCSASMTQDLAGVAGLSCRDGEAAMCMVTARTETDYEIVAFTSGGYGYGRRGSGLDGITPLDISPRQRLDDVVRAVGRQDWGGTDCSLPMQWAESKGKEFDAFYVYTDNETWAGSIHPSEALVKYRNRSQIHDAKLVVVGMVANGFSIADPNDAGMLDVVGFDTATPNVMSQFVAGTV